MGSRARNFVLVHRRAGGFAQAVLAYLADCMNDQSGRCDPTRETIAEYFSAKDDPCTVKRVERALARLRTLGYIESKRVPYTRQTSAGQEGGWHNSYVLVGFVPGDSNAVRVTDISDVTPKTDVTPDLERGHPQNVQGVTPNLERGHPQNGGINQKEPERTRSEPESSMRTSGNSSAIAAVASAQAQTLPTSFPQSSNSQNHSETKPAGKDSLPNASERSVAAHRDRPDTSDEQTRQNDAGCSQNASTRISGVCPENEPPPMSDEDLENLFANAQLEECPPFPEKGDHPSEKDAHLSSGDKKPARKKPATTAFCAVPRPDDVDPQVWDDWLTTRRAKRLPLTQTALNSVRREAASAGLTFQAAVTFAVEQGWAAFRAEWYRNATRKGDSTKTNARYLTAQERYEERMRKAGEMSDEEYFAQFDLPEEILNYEKAQEAKRHVAS